jgi:hypothetical protein
MSLNKNFQCLLQENDTAHVFLPDHQGETTAGKVVHVFYLKDNYANPYYVISVPGNNGVSDRLVVRSSVLETRKYPVLPVKYDTLIDEIAGSEEEDV